MHYLSGGNLLERLYPFKTIAIFYLIFNLHNEDEGNGREYSNISEMSVYG